MQSGFFFMVAISSWLLMASDVPAAVLDTFGPPPAGDPSAFTGPLIGENFAVDFESLPPSNAGAFAGGPTGTFRDAGVNNAVPQAQLLPGVDVPTNSKPS